MPGDGERSQMQFFKIDVKMAGGLGGVNGQGDPCAVTELRRLVEREQCSTDIGSVADHHETGVFPDQRQQIPGFGAPGAVCRDT